jgi:voltage-dependent anion channel protein 2
MKQERFNSTASIDVFKGPIVTADAVLGLDRLTLGGEVSYSLNDGKLAKYNAALGYSAQDYVVSLHALSSFNEFSASYYHRVNADLEAGAKATWDRKYSNGTVNIEVGSKYNLDRETFVKSKINNLGIFSLGYTQELRKGFKTTLAGSLDTAKLDSLRLGVSFAYEA